MAIDDFSIPVNLDPKLSKALEAIIGKLRSDDSERKANSSQKANRRIQLTEKTNDSEMANLQLERILGGNDLTDINYLAIGLQRARSVARVVIRQNGRLLGYGTGFLVAPGVLMTNEHVFESAAMVKESRVQFQYEKNARGQDVEPVEFGLRLDPEPIIDKRLDFAIVAVEPLASNRKSVRDFDWLKLNPSPGKAFVGEYLTIIQHPGGQRKQICVRENKLLKYVDELPFIWYQTDTVGGSSGSPAFNTSWDVVALHHKSIPKVSNIDGKDVWMAKNGQIWTEAMGDDEVDWIANEGVRISAILDFLTRTYPAHPSAQAVLSAGDPPAGDSFESIGGMPGGGGIRIAKGADGKIKVLVPVELDLDMNVELGTSVLAEAVSRAFPKGPGPKAEGNAGGSAGPAAVEKVEIDTSNYNLRNGYQPNFLGSDLIVPLPKVVGDRFGKPLKVTGNITELKYWNYSVVMNADRGLAFFSAGNIAPKERRGSQDGNQFIRDPRVDLVSKKAQIGSEFYKKAKRI